ncbi:helix-turn-helix transcriptional regulator [Limosilactobacillus coleohominis]|uniref:helix-turn-helix transcriptional regulator n=1 Tax=Limosilactobacillus coleohominis TaxID=181675 RepID=UPI0019584444|nr:helix-turn-helix domain-containing protein [Limosilactobacillus coleohominis]MBM6955450.1 helix-turn-helix domain-containing protein [Limosilactobacillus coleohominis]
MEFTFTIPDSALQDALTERMKTYKPVDPFPAIMDKRTASKFLGCGRATLDKWIKEYDDFPVAVIGGSYRFTKSDLEQWVKSRSQEHSH